MVFNAALSGIQAASKELDIIGNNVSNSGTMGFKQSRAEFADVYAASALGTGSNAVGSGVRLANVRQSFSQGNISFTNNNLDLAVNGAGFFRLNDGGTTTYSRGGGFGIDNQGYVVNSSQQRLTGLTADGTGNISGLVGDLRIDSSNISPQATTSLEMGVNLFANAVPPSINWGGGATPPSTSYNNVTSQTIYDSLGNPHVISSYFIKADGAATNPTDPNASTPVSTENQWYVAFQIDNVDVPALGATNNTDNLYRLNFNSDGTFNSAADTANNPLPQNLIPITLNVTGAQPLSFNINFNGNSASTQFGAAFSVQATSQNGFTTGRLDGVDVDSSGVIFGRYTNGQSKSMGQVQLANFANVNGLQPLGDSSWGESNSSGQPLVSSPGTASLGLIQSGALEDSNVDLTSELVHLITAQRNFQANAQTIKTADTVTQTIINLR